mgnify:CR=1 FL=1
MRELFESGKITDVKFNNDEIIVTMTQNKCFDIRILLNGYYSGCFETSSTCDWNIVKRYVNSLIK